MVAQPVHLDRPKGGPTLATAVANTKDLAAFQARVDAVVHSHPVVVDNAYTRWFAKPLGLQFEDLGKRRHGTASTLFFCDELLRIYGHEDPSIAEGASYAVENWAAAGFWKELIAGLKAFKERQCPDLPLAFWTWHDKVEDQHAAHTDDELTEAFGLPGFDEEKFLRGASEMLDGVKAFWDGLWADRS